jgi:hypothetical protein
MKFQVGQIVTVMGQSAKIISLDIKKKRYKVYMGNFIIEVAESVVK